MRVFSTLAIGVSLAAGSVPAIAWADEPVTIVLKDHRFEPSEVRVKANSRSQIVVKNQDDTADEFESPDLRVEKVIPGGREGVIRLPPLAPGRYSFTGEYHSDTAHGVVIAE